MRLSRESYVVLRKTGVVLGPWQCCVQRKEACLCTRGESSLQKVILVTWFQNGRIWLEGLFASTTGSVPVWLEAVVWQE